MSRYSKSYQRFVVGDRCHGRNQVRDCEKTIQHFRNLGYAHHCKIVNNLVSSKMGWGGYEVAGFIWASDISKASGTVDIFR